MICELARYRMQLQYSRSSGRVIRNAMGQYNRIAEVIEELRVFHQRVKLMESEPERMMGLRQLVIDNDSAFYVIEDILKNTDEYNYNNYKNNMKYPCPLIS